MMSNTFFQKSWFGTGCGRAKGLALAALAAGAVLLAGAAAAKPVITHDPVRVAVKGEPLGLRATVRDAGGRVSSVAVFYASSRGMTPFRRDMSTTGAGIWFGSIPGHLIGPGTNLFYYIHADNLEGESADTDWTEVRVIEPGIAAEDIPSATVVAQQAQRASSGTSGGKAGAAPAAPSAAPSDRSKYWIPAAVIIGGAAAVGGGIALANSGGGGGGGGSSHKDGGSVTNGNYGGSYNVCFETPGTASTNAPATCDSGLVNVYVDNGAVQVVGLWGGEVLGGSVIGSSFTAVGEVAGRLEFPPAHLIVSGDVGGSSCSARVDGYSTDPARPGNFTGSLATTRR